MDDFIDPFLSPPTWSVLNTPSRSSWTGNGASQANDLLAGSVEAYAEDGNNTSICVIPSTHIAEHVASEDFDHRSNLLLNGVFESNSISGSYGQDLNTSCSLTLPHSALTMSSSIESIASEPCKFVQSLGDGNFISVPSMWPPLYAGVSSFTEHGDLQGFGFQGMETDADALGIHYAENRNYLQMNNSATTSLQDDNGLNSPNLPTFNLAQQVKIINGCLQPLKQLSQSTEANSLKHQTNHSTGGQEIATPTSTNGCSGTAEPRARARRGQATDPHSIAERLRREKIAERMKNLQELVPDSNKVLSMSRLGAAGAVVPLIIDRQTEGSTFHLSSKELEGADLSEAERSLALEQEVVNLLELNLMTAMQYLQNKGLCLMPIALASAISGEKGSSSAAVPPERRKPNGNPQNLSKKINGENGAHNICSGGSVIKQEEAVKSI